MVIKYITMSDNNKYLMPIEDKIEILKLAVEASNSQYIKTKTPVENYNEMIAAIIVEVLVPR